jgi:hypothetical protein
VFGYRVFAVTTLKICELRLVVNDFREVVADDAKETDQVAQIISSPLVCSHTADRVEIYLRPIHRLAAVVRNETDD